MPSEPDVVVVPASDALLGDPPRTMHVNVFAIARAPVTNAEFAAFATEAAYRAPKWHDGEAGTAAEGLSWADAVSYCRWLSIATGHIYRLPDEREWEKAARAGVLAGLGQLREWTNTWSDGARVLRGASSGDPHGDALFTQRWRTTDELAAHGFRVVRSMTGR